jgi:hypothetical protein
MGLLSTIGGVLGGALGGPVGSTIGTAAGGFLEGERERSEERRDAATANQWSLKLQKDQQAFNSREAWENRNWYKAMSDGAIRRQVRDLKYAGLNPILAARMGGAPVSSQTPASSSIGSAFKANSAQAAVSRETLVNQQRQTSSQIQVNEQNILRTKQDIKNMQSAQNLTEAQIDATAQTIEKTKQEIKRLLEQTKGQAQTNELRQIIIEAARSADLKGLLNRAGKETNNIYNIYTQQIGKWLGTSAHELKEYLGKDIGGFGEDFRMFKFNISPHGPIFGD